MLPDRDIADAIVAMLGGRAAQASICPSEVARALDAKTWRELMPQVRGAAAGLAVDGRIRATQGDDEVPPHSITDAKGPIRLRRGLRFGSS